MTTPPGPDPARTCPVGLIARISTTPRPRARARAGGRSPRRRRLAPDERLGRVKRPSVRVQGEAGAAGVVELQAGPRGGRVRPGPTRNPMWTSAWGGVLVAFNPPHDRGEPAPVLAERDVVDLPEPIIGAAGVRRQWPRGCGRRATPPDCEWGQPGYLVEGLTIGAEPDLTSHPVDPAGRSRLELRQPCAGADVVQPDTVGDVEGRHGALVGAQVEREDLGPRRLHRRDQLRVLTDGGEQAAPRLG